MRRGVILFGSKTCKVKSIGLRRVSKIHQREGELAAAVVESWLALAHKTAMRGGARRFASNVHL
jgi:hypothetical protein